MIRRRLENKIALVTGAAQGIGKEIASVFTKEGATVIVSDVNDSLGASVAVEIGGTTSFLHLDVTQEGDWQNITTKIIDQYGKLDILVNNAGITGFQEGFGPQDPENATLDNWRSVQAVNSDGVFLGCKYTLQIMKRSSNASIINISSRSGLVGIPGAAAYAASKAAVRKLYLPNFPTHRRFFGMIMRACQSIQVITLTGINRAKTILHGKLQSSQVPWIN